ncbi:MAG: cellulase family glycosylhydrolase [Candidatus Parcubacteria bacterium]|nr:cellulase family glycosylhydrolase [Candidatus Parcubacteria bacterium]
MMRKKTKIIIFMIVFFIVLICVAIAYWAHITYQPNRQTTYGVTFSKEFAQYIGVDWKQAYLAILDDLKVKYIRIPTYWDQLEPERNIYNFKDFDWQIDEATKRDVRIILVLGRRQPRWPECHDPVWVSGLPKTEVRAKILHNIEIIVNHYKANKSVEIWQVENEPFLDFFGRCPKMTKQELQEEIDLVRSLDNRKILITDSGELSTWYPAIKMGNIFGTTLYRTTYNKYFGYWNYFFLPASYYRLKALIWVRSKQKSAIS